MLEQLSSQKLCELLCADVSMHRRDGYVMLKTPFTYPDGDGYALYLSELASGGLRVSDGGHTLMHLSYTNELDKFFDGTRGALLEQIVKESGVQYGEEKGEFYIDSPINNLPESTFQLGQALTRIHDLTFLNRTQVKSTFYDDLKAAIFQVVSEEVVEADYEIAGLENAANYPVDFKLTKASGGNLFLFGIPNKDKARLTTIFLQYYLQHHIEFDSLLVFQDQQEIPRSDLARLTNVSGEMIASPNAVDDFRRKLKRKCAA